MPRKGRKRRLQEFQAQTAHTPDSASLTETTNAAANSTSTMETNGHGKLSLPAEPSSNPANDSAEKKEEEPWQTASRTKRRRVENEPGRVKYPELILHHKSPLKIQLSELQNLALYTLADGMGPNWISFKNARHTRKVVVVMVPGLEMGMFDDSPAFPELHKHSPPIPETHKDFPIPLKVQNLAESLKPLAGLSDHVWSVRAGGDSKSAKYHSAVQALLVVPLPKVKDNKNKNGHAAPKEAKGWKAERTPVTAFIHTASELEETGYPIHPVTYGDDSEAASLEATRRSRTSQDEAGGWVDTKVTSLAEAEVPETEIEAGSITSGRTLYAVDCEMVVTTDHNFTLARISIVDWQGKPILDELVKPSLPVEQYHTQFSGITEQLLAPVTTTLQDIQAKLLTLFTPQTILLGHSLESDLAAMKMTHPFIIDTALIYPHARGLPLRNSLRFLTQRYLSREIQQHATQGHDSIEDAIAVLDLVKLKCEKGPKWGTPEASSESLFRRLGKNTVRDAASGQERPIRSAIVDYGAPERGFGREANVHVATKSDEEVVQGILRAVGRKDGGGAVAVEEIEKEGEMEIDEGINGSENPGVDFVWARFRELEKARGWTDPITEEKETEKQTLQAAGKPTGETEKGNPFSLPTTDTTTTSSSKHLGSKNPFSALSEPTTCTDSEETTTAAAATNQERSKPVLAEFPPPKIPQPSNSTATAMSDGNPNPNAPLLPASTSTLPSTLPSTLLHTSSLLHRLSQSLPPLTLLIIYSGTGDPRAVHRLQAQHAQFRREYKVKKWDELSVKWTDREEQELREEVERVRGGVGFVGVV